jgi:hypothetical protein
MLRFGAAFSNVANPSCKVNHLVLRWVQVIVIVYKFSSFFLIENVFGIVAKKRC